MENFRFCVGTDIRFGKGQIENLPEVLSIYGKKVLLTYGGGSIKKIGLYQEIKKLLKDFEVFELGGIEPNPRVESVEAGAKICKEKEIDVILAVGGGSTIDCSKAIAAGAFYEGDPWEFIVDSSKIKKALPLCTVLTLAATGSEMDAGGVITNLSTKQKLGFGHPILLPKVSILDPEYTYSVSKYQTAAGAIDMMSHIFEVYFDEHSVGVPDRISEGLLINIIKYAPLALTDPTNYEARAQLMWSGTLAINGLCSTGKECAWSCHPIEHELSAYNDMTHGVGLGIVTPRWMEYILSDKTVAKFAQYAVAVWDVEENLDQHEQAKLGIEATKKFFESLGIPMNLHDVGIGKEQFKEMAKKAVEHGSLEYAYVPLNQIDVEKILEMCL